MKRLVLTFVKRPLVFLLVLCQAGFTVFFLVDILSSVVGFRTRPLSWETREILEIGASLSLIFGMGLGLWHLLAVGRDLRETNKKLQVASSEFFELVEEEFKAWGLSPAEHELGIYLLKGFSHAEIGEMTGKAPGTIKTQSNALFRKSGLANRTQLVSYFIEVLLSEPLLSEATSDHISEG